MWALLLLAACSPAGPSAAVTDPRFGVEIRTAHGTAAELETSQELLALLARHDLSPWIVTRSVVIDEEAEPHSHPVLTLNTRHRADDGRLLSGFVHEQLHWYLATKPEQVSAALSELQGLFPEAPVGYPEGAESRTSTYLHLLIGWLEGDALTRLVGNDEARRVLEFWAGDHYRWVYRTVLAQRPLLGEIVTRYGLRV